MRYHTDHLGLNIRLNNLLTPFSQHVRPSNEAIHVVYSW